ncbi:hypothetical protein P691DRAFT_812856 [Macrolepiota fuliginosa MF-IS2]|uniref:Uncharacterized protein n=1 Tax=Macrolepiota fuliginosa MF-IS2 TaxID=1400762 RepID=A0A9P5XG36_9AGAR|nr:hypothetical protein P691DRAFT_812856 [Macrolepiota fuliginosa MF-IS2]
MKKENGGAALSVRVLAKEFVVCDPVSLFSSLEGACYKPWCALKKKWWVKRTMQRRGRVRCFADQRISAYVSVYHVPLFFPSPKTRVFLTLPACTHRL